MHGSLIKIKQALIFFILLALSILTKANSLVFNVFDCRAKGETFLQISGIANKQIIVGGNNLTEAKNTVKADDKSVVYLDNNREATQSGNAIFNYASCDFQAIDDRKIRILSPADVTKKRLEIIRAIWGSDKIPDCSDVIVTTNVASPLHPYPFISRVDKIEIPVHAIVAAGAMQIKDLAFYFVPVMRNNRLVIINPGHTCSIKAVPKDGNAYRIEETIVGLLQAGFDVLAVYMPHVSETNCNLDHCSIINTDLGPGAHPATFGLRFFLEPEIASLNYLLKQNKYKNVSMVGLSGGGWTTSLLAAIDDRIKYSFSVAGSMPIYHRYGGSVGDVEQFLPQMYRDIAGYPDLYVLGSYGKDRKQIQVLNRNDNCCFGQKQHDPKRNYDDDLKTFGQTIKDRLKSIGAEDHYILLIDEVATCHEISVYALDIILQELKGKSK